MKDSIDRLKKANIKPSAQRLAIAEYVLTTVEHPSADEVWQKVRAGFPMVSRATVYNTLNLFVERGLLRTYTINEGHVVFDPNTSDHNHFVDEVTGAIEDLPLGVLKVSTEGLQDKYEISDCHVILRGRKKTI